MQTIDIAQGGSDNRARHLGKTRSKLAKILTGLFSPAFSKALRMAGPPSPETAPKRVTKPNAVPSIRKLSRPKPKSSPDKVFGTHRDVDPENQRPVQIFRQHAAEQRAGD